MTVCKSRIVFPLQDFFHGAKAAFNCEYSYFVSLQDNPVEYTVLPFDLKPLS